MIGKNIGSYKIESVIGEGGMGIVYKGRSTKLGHNVAVKLMHPYLLKDKEYLRRFENEARIMARLNEHPNIVKVYDLITDGAVVCIVMEYIEGVTFESLIQTQGPLPWQRAISLFIPLLDALDHAHYNGVIHRDLKPGNFILQNLHGTQIPKIMDFGIARDLALSKRMTATGMKMGALLYMSPEQAHGAKEITHLTDIYSMGVAMFEIMTGRVPFDNNSDFELMRSIINEPPPPIRTFKSDIPVWLETVLQKAMVKNPAGRFSSANQLKHALLKGEPAGIPKPKPQPRHPVVSQLSQIPVMKPKNQFEKGFTKVTPTPGVQSNSGKRGVSSHAIFIAGGILTIAIMIALAIILTSGREKTTFLPTSPDHPIEYYNITGVSSWDVLWMRTDPNPNSSKVGSVPYDGKCAQYLGNYEYYKNAKWLKIRFQGKQGWVNSKYLTRNNHCN